MSPSLFFCLEENLANLIFRCLPVSEVSVKIVFRGDLPWTYTGRAVRQNRTRFSENSLGFVRSRKSEGMLRKALSNLVFQNEYLKFLPDLFLA